MSSFEKDNGLRANIELEAERFIEEKTSRVIFRGVGAVALAFILGSTLATRFDVVLTLQLFMTAATPIILYYAARVVYIRTIEHERVLRFMLMDEGIQI